MSATTSDAKSAPFGFRVLPVPEAVSDARRRVVAVVGGWRPGIPEDALHDVELLTGEVVANAVKHTGSPCAVYVHWTGDRVRVEVTDVDPRLPEPADFGQEQETGRGLYLVDSLAADWGSKAGPTGKVVWFEVGPRDTTAPTRSRRSTAQVSSALPFTSSASQPGDPRQPHQFS
ncbi:ATP-binding protein [Streptomyces sp. NBC_01476]|uniref:ATP-binding protein n=1 Tax=Streptomyces sp. NBC_01476 TaxID=2903881 RepID=UPI002E31D897|nr:ATP-binding protein [Streptomyces sp. NBC_01476]